MEPFVCLTSVAAPIEGRNIDTDQIIPARFLKMDREGGYGQYLFHDLRFDDTGAEQPGFVLNRPLFRNARILVTDANFGCGSSREGAAYALYDYGVRALLAPSFGDIFYNNCLKNGIVPVRLPEATVTALRTQLAGADGGERPQTRRWRAGPPEGDEETSGGRAFPHEVTVDLDRTRVILPDGSEHSFAMDSFWRECLMQGKDEIGLTLGYLPRIESFERAYRARNRWLNY